MAKTASPTAQRSLKHFDNVTVYLVVDNELHSDDLDGDEMVIFSNSQSLSTHPYFQFYSSAVNIAPRRALVSRNGNIPKAAPVNLPV